MLGWLRFWWEQRRWFKHELEWDAGALGDLKSGSGWQRDDYGEQLLPEWRKIRECGEGK